MPGSAVPQQMSATMPNTNRPVRNATVPAPVQTRTLVPAAPIRIPVPVFNEEKSPQSEIPITDLDYFFTKILKWNATWLDEYGKIIYKYLSKRILEFAYNLPNLNITINWLEHTF